jgi:hypothetical protein
LTGRSHTTALQHTREKRGSCVGYVESLPLDGHTMAPEDFLLNKKMWGNLRYESAQDSLPSSNYCTQDAGGFRLYQVCAPFFFSPVRGWRR